MCLITCTKNKIKAHSTNPLPPIGLSGLGYGKINPIHKTSITKSAITDQAGLSYINTSNLDSQDSQQALNLSSAMTLLIKRSTMAVFWIKLLMIDKVIL